MGIHAELAVKYFEDGYTCAQAVVLAFSDITRLDGKIALRTASSFGGGIGRLREVCGALTGALAVIGYLYGFDEPNSTEKGNHYKRVQEIGLDFEKQFGCLSCRDLLGLNVKHDTPFPTPRTADFYKTRPCGKFIEYAAEITEKYISEHGVPNEN